MAGHSKFKNIMHRKGAQDKKRAKVFTKVLREISVAVKMGGPDQNSNPRLRSALLEARSANMPKDNIDKAIVKASGASAGDSNYEETTYEGYAQGGVAVIVEALTDNRNRTAAEVRTAFVKNGGTMGESGSVSYMFEKVGIIGYNSEEASFDEIFEQAVEAGSDDVVEEDGEILVITATDKLHTVYNFLIAEYTKASPTSSNIKWRTTIPVEITEQDKLEKIIKVIDALEDLDDVQKVYTNFEASDDLLEKVS